MLSNEQDTSITLFASPSKGQFHHPATAICSRPEPWQRDKRRDPFAGRLPAWSPHDWPGEQGQQGRQRNDGYVRGRAAQDHQASGVPDTHAVVKQFATLRPAW